jgi:hypothetical protein
VINMLFAQGAPRRLVQPAHLKMMLMRLFLGKHYDPAQYDGIFIESNHVPIMFLKNSVAGNGEILHIQSDLVLEKLKQLVEDWELKQKSKVSWTTILAGLGLVAGLVTLAY